jgi:hypothetical protein
MGYKAHQRRPRKHACISRTCRGSKSNTEKEDADFLVEELEQLQAYIETFYDDELVIPDEGLEIEDAVPFSKWSREVCDRVLDELDRCANRT